MRKGGPFPVPAQWKPHFHARSFAGSSSHSMSAVASPGRSGTTITTTTTTTTPMPRTPASTGGGGQQRPGRLRTCLARIPLCTTLVTILCLALQLCVVLLHWDIGQYAISPAAVLEGHEYMRLLTAPYFHVNLLHIAMNMLSFVGIGAFLEFQQGTLYLFMTIAYATLITNVAYIALCEILFQATKNTHWYYYSSIGFSGIIFQLAVLETYTAPPGSTRSIFGMCNVPAKLYPWALLVLIQVVMPNISFVGHLAGLLVGILQAYGFLGFLFPPRRWVNAMEASPGCSPVVRCGQYILAPEASDRDRNALCSLLGRLCFGSSGSSGGGSTSGGGFLGSPRRRNFGGGTTGTAASSAAAASSPPSARQQPPPPVATAVPVVAAVGGSESPHTRAAGTDGRGWRRIEDHDVEEGDLEVGGGYQQQGEGGGQDGQQRRIVL